MKYFNNRGAVALITTIIISLLLSIIIIGVMIVMVSELRQSNDNEQSIRAYYAAEAGVEDAMSKLSTRTNQACDGTATSKNLNLDSASPGLVGWSCQQITFSGQPSGSLPLPDKAVQLDLTGAQNNWHSIVLEWDTAPTHNDFSPAVLSSAASWGTARPAAMELTVVDYPSGAGATFNDTNLKIGNALIVPGPPAAATTGDVSNLSGNNPIRGACTGVTTYHCQVLLNNFAPNSRTYMLRLRTRYVGTEYKMTAWTSQNGNGSKIAIPDGTATSDVTGKAGNVFRRVVYKVPYSKGAAAGLDYVLFSDVSVCKDLSVIGGVQQPSACP